MLCRWRSFLAFVALKLCEAGFVACLVLARTKRSQRAPMPPSQTSAASVPSTMTSPMLGGAGTGGGPASRLRQHLSKMSAEAATYLAALLEVCLSSAVTAALGYAAAADEFWMPGLISSSLCKHVVD
jgi:hypothetical protein